MIRPLSPADDKEVDATGTSAARLSGTLLLLRHCLSLGWAANRVPARTRLELMIGPELARQLMTSLTAQSRR